MLVAQLPGRCQKLLRRFSAAGTQQLVNAHDRVLRHVHELGATLEVRGQRVSPGGAGDLGLLAQRRSSDAQVLERAAVLKQGLERDLIETVAALSAPGLGALRRQRIGGSLQRFLAHGALPRKATSTFSGRAPTEVNSVSM